MANTTNYVKNYQYKIAYPTIALTIFAILAYVGASLGAYFGILGIGWAILVNVIMAYLLFTSMHEAGHTNISGNKPSAKWIDEVIGWVEAEKAKLDEVERDQITIAFKVDEEVKMGMVSDVQMELRKANARKLMYSVPQRVDE